MKDYFNRSLIWSVASASALVLAFALATAGTARAGNAVLMAEGGTTDDNGNPGDAGHLAMAGVINTKADGAAKSLNVTISYEDNLTDGFVCTLTTPSDFTPSGGGTAKLTVSASDPLCFEMNDPADTFSNAGNFLTFKGYSIGGKIRLWSRIPRSTILTAMP
jgi:hypothetical protein